MNSTACTYCISYRLRIASIGWGRYGKIRIGRIASVECNRDCTLLPSQESRHQVGSVYSCASNCKNKTNNTTLIKNAALLARPASVEASRTLLAAKGLFKKERRATMTAPKCLVIGANGNLGSMLTKRLLLDGHETVGTVQDLSHPSVSEMRQFVNSNHLEMVQLRLPEITIASQPQATKKIESDGGFAQFESDLRQIVANDDVEWIFYVAGINHIGKDHVETILTLLKAANKMSMVRRFILTSSLAAIGKKDLHAPSFTEDDWSCWEDDTELNSIQKIHQAHALGERAAWDFVKSNSVQFTLSVIHPGLMLGPVCLRNLPTSDIQCKVISATMDGLNSGLDSQYQVTDVRDLVQALLQAAKLDEAAGKRFIVFSSASSKKELVTSLKTEFNPMGYTISNTFYPKFVYWPIQFFGPLHAHLYNEMNKSAHFDNSRSIHTLKMSYIDPINTFIDGAHSLIEFGIVKRTPGYTNSRRED